MDDQLSRPGTDRRAKGVVTLIDGGTPLPESSIVYFANEKSAAEDQWTRITSQENLAAINANPEQFKLLTLFTVPVDELARAPIAHVARAQAELDKIERRRAKAERRTGDRLPDGPLRWDDSPDLLDMKAGANELQSAVERAANSSLNFMQIRTADAAAAVAYAKYLSILAGTAQAGRCRAQGGITNNEVSNTACQSQAVPSELASLKKYHHNEFSKEIHDDPCGEFYKVEDVQSLFSHSAATGKVPEGFVLMPVRLAAENGAKAALIGEFKESIQVPCPEFHDEDEDYECATCENFGEVSQDVTVSWETIKDIYARAVEVLASPAAPLAGKAEPDAVYQVKAGQDLWHDTDKEHWDNYVPESRRIVYTAPLPPPSGHRRCNCPAV